MLDGVSREWLAVERSEADVPAKGLPDSGFRTAEGVSEGVICVASVVKRRPVDRPMTWEKGL